MARNLAVGVLVVVLILTVLASLFISFQIFLKDKNKPYETPYQGTVFLGARAGGVSVSANYFLSGYNLSKGGVIPLGSFERVEGLWSNSSYVVRASAEGFYAGVSYCNVNVSDKCFVDLKKVASLGYKAVRKADGYYAQWGVSDGFLVEPVVCEGHDINIIRVSAFDLNNVSLARAVVPSRLAFLMDSCWSVPYNSGDRIDVVFRVESYDALTSADFVNIRLVDKCSVGLSENYGYEDCGCPDTTGVLPLLG